MVPLDPLLLHAIIIIITKLRALIERKKVLASKKRHIRLKKHPLNPRLRHDK